MRLAFPYSLDSNFVIILSGGQELQSRLSVVQSSNHAIEVLVERQDKHVMNGRVQGTVVTQGKANARYQLLVRMRLITGSCATELRQ